ncbi:hypothetical protein [Sneathiella sp.]|uniref:hypothetical protein n=1 Tax=Sneathiella sp. TaxID=1964365 RepID=UPI002FE0290E
MSLHDVKNEKFGYAHELVGRPVEFEQEGQPHAGDVIRYQEPVGTDSQSNIAIADPDSLNGERYNPLDATRFK